MRKTDPDAPFRLLRESLRKSRKCGAPFEEAWPRALASVHWGKHWLGGITGGALRELIDSTRPEWRAAYLGEETRFSIAVANRELFADGLADYIVGDEPVSA